MKKNKVPVLILILFLVLGTAWVVGAAPKLLSNAKPGDCKACHGDQKVLPDGHAKIEGMTWKECQNCHTPKQQNLLGKIPASHVHLLGGVTCVQCHGKGQPKAVEMATCVKCHGSPDDLAKKTANVKPENPHTSPHYGTTLDCNLCHHQHAKSENYCNQCHTFDYKVP